MILSRYRKTIAAVLGGVLTWAGTAYVPDGRIDRAEWFALALALATAAGVYGVSNAPPSPPLDDRIEVRGAPAALDRMGL